MLYQRLGIRLVFGVALGYLMGCAKNDSNNPRQIYQENLTEVKRFSHHRVAIRLWADEQFIYTSDAPDNTVTVYKHTGQFIKKIGTKGQAPWENGTVWHFAWDEDKNFYWVHDYPKQLFKRIDSRTNRLDKSMRVITIDNVQYIGQSKVLVPGMDDKTGRFNLSLYDISQGKLLQTRDLSALLGLDNPTVNDRLDFVLNGNMCIAPDRKYSVHYCYNAGYFFKIDNQRFQVEVIQDVRKQPLPKATIAYGAVRLNPEQLMVRSATVSESNLYALTSLGGNFSKTDQFFVDVYQLSTNQYRGSFQLKTLADGQRPVHLAMAGPNKLVVYYEDSTVVIYNIANPV